MCLIFIKYTPRNTKALSAADDSLAAPRIATPPQPKNQASSFVARLPSIRGWHGSFRNKLGRGKDIDVENFEELGCDSGDEMFDALLGTAKQDLVDFDEREAKRRAEVERFEKLKQTKQRLAEARAGFQESMDKLNEELVIVKADF